MAWAGYDGDHFRFVHGKPTKYVSSSGVGRTFCGCCGTSLTLMDKRFPNEVYVSLSSFKDEDAPFPEIHLWHSERLAWVETADNLPRFKQFKSDGVTKYGQLKQAPNVRDWLEADSVSSAECASSAENKKC